MNWFLTIFFNSMALNFVYSLISFWTFGLFSLWAVTNTVLNIHGFFFMKYMFLCGQVFMWTYIFISLR